MVNTTPEKQKFNQPEQTASAREVETTDYPFFESKTPEQVGNPSKIRGFGENGRPPKGRHTRTFTNDFKKKGFDFEKYVVKKFNKKNYKLKDWDGKHYLPEDYVETSKQPDLIYEFQQGEVQAGFAVECKWRSKFCHSELEIASYQQIKDYKAFEKKSGFPVFITLGIGGEPMAPKHLYVIPLNKIFSNKLDSTFLMEFEQVPSQHFIYDYRTKSLLAKPYPVVQEQA
ncbi:hypothetical protein [Adhaeribacter pallidiroseus]|uniref:hypothetical protein n=1 Tax=Adhaeribacter pallidiroseus TaxID=2072847 RepID=UPI000E1BC2DF|nr:hypothetical protein [Adhaeribacter pallidiroseus]